MVIGLLNVQQRELYISYNILLIIGILKLIDFWLIMILVGDDVRKCWGEDDFVISFCLWM